jgi:hypothetical protein
MFTEDKDLERSRLEYESGQFPEFAEIEDHIVDCCNPDCGWTGLHSQTVQMKHGFPNGLCPECHEVTEPGNGP